MYPQYARNNFCQPYPALENTTTSSKSWKTRKSRCFTHIGHCTRNMLGTTFVSHTQPWKTPEHRQNREKTRKSCFFLFCGNLLWEPDPHKTLRTCSKQKKQTWSYSILLCMKTVLQWFRGQSGTWWPRNQTLKNVREGAFVLVGTGFDSLNTQKRTRTLTGTPIFIFSLSPVNYTSETP